MHEMSVAQNIIDSVLSEAISKNAHHVKEINVDVGELMQLDTRVLSEAMYLLFPSYPELKGARFKLNKSEASFSCRKCGFKFTMNIARKELKRVSKNLLVNEPDSKELPLHFLPYLYPTFVHCPKCKTSDCQVSEGGEDIILRKLVMD
jgi:hydrogenase nickel incorporation protein HypA/HybF